MQMLLNAKVICALDFYLLKKLLMGSYGLVLVNIRILELLRLENPSKIQLFLLCQAQH